MMGWHLLTRASQKPVKLNFYFFYFYFCPACLQYANEEELFRQDWMNRTDSPAHGAEPQLSLRGAQPMAQNRNSWHKEEGKGLVLGSVVFPKSHFDFSPATGSGTSSRAHR